MTKYFIIDFDSTFISAEGLEVLAEVSLKSNPKKLEILAKIKKLTDLGMEGKIGFLESLTDRLNLIKAHKKDLEKAVKILKKQISPSVLRNKHFFKTFKDQIYIVSGGFLEFVLPVVSQFGIDKSHIFANEFTYQKAKITGFDKTNVMAKTNGKVAAVKSLKLKGEIIVIGDGITDYALKEAGVASKFIAFTENIEREISKKADHIAPSFDEFLFVNNLPTSVSFPKNRIKVLLLENIDVFAKDFMEREGFSVERLKTGLDEDELIKKMKDVHILGVRSKTKVTKKVLESSPKLMAIGCFSVGTDNVDLEVAASKGIAVFNAPYQNTRSVVELVIGNIIMLLRRIFEKSTKLHSGTWDKSVERSFEVRGKRLGIIGYGNIGSQISVLAENLGMQVIFYDPIPKLALGNAKRAQNLDELLKKSDVITVHVDGSSRNSNLISESEFKKMKDSVIFINLSRGFIVDLQALTSYIKSGKIAGAAIDVFPNEPKATGDKFESDLQNLPNVILTPHIGGNTIEAQAQIAEYVSFKLMDFINNGNTFLSMSLPSIQPAEMKNLPAGRQVSHRLLHIHQNVPGILAKINSILSKNGINILAQSLKTNDYLGYVVTDVNEEYDKKVLSELKEIPDTIRFRVLY